MEYFYYCIRDQEGRIHEGRIRAENREEAVRWLIGQGCWVLGVSLHRRPIRGFNLDHLMRRQVSRQELTWFFRELSTLVAAGVPLMKSLDTLQEQASSKTLRAVLSGVVRDLKSGGSLAKTLMAREDVFPLIAVRMIGSGEAGGGLDRVLSRISLYLEREQELVKQVKSATLYPALLAGFAFFVTIFLVGYVVPRLTRAFHYDISALPGITQFMLRVATGIENWLWPLMVSVVVIGLILKWYRGTPRGRIRMDRLIMTFPFAGSIIRKLGVARLCYNMGILLQSGLSIIETLEICETTADNAILAGAIRDVRYNVYRGQSLAGSLRDSRLFDPLVIQMVTIGEETGRLDEGLLRIAGYYEAETEHFIRAGISLLEPFLIIIMALIVGLIVSVTVLPMLDMMTVF
ncbi:MAG: type II secretion system F family protein [Bacillota bacterium]